ncbi:MAG TPA: helix-turn-helix domain-containing protein [Polyangiales bacterium]
MDALLAAAEALAHGDPLRALGHVALRDDARALALRATALAQLGEHADAKRLFQRALTEMPRSDALARARCELALAELALATRELPRVDAMLARAVSVLDRHHDTRNAAYARMLRARHALARGFVERAQRELDGIDSATTGPVLVALIALTRTEIALRQMQPEHARRALVVAGSAALRAQVPALLAEVDACRRAILRPCARRLHRGSVVPLSLVEVRALFDGPHLIVDACRRVVLQGDVIVRYATRPVLFALLRRLAEAAPGAVDREQLIRVGFGMQRSNDALRARLRVAMGRLRKQLEKLASLHATEHGFALVPRAAEVHVLLPPHEDEASSLLALVSDGEAWSTSALALALGGSQRSIQRALSVLEREGRVKSLGRGKNRRWLAPPMLDFATHMLLPAASPRD